MKILVVDDTATNLESAKITLAGHELTLMSSEREARELFIQKFWSGSGKTDGQPPFDAVLLDLLMPHDREKPEPNDWQFKNWTKFNDRVGQLFVAGYGLALLAIANGVKHVAVATMGDHHQHPAMEQQDILTSNFNINGATASFRMAPTIMIDTPDGPVEAKDWGKVLAGVIGNG